MRTMGKLYRLCILILPFLISCTWNKSNWPDIQPPVAKKIPHELNYHGEKIIDNYFWLRERDNPEVIKYLEAENEYTDKMMAHTKDLQEKLFQELKSRIKETDLSVPEFSSGYYYYSRTEEGKQYPILCRKKGSLEADEEIILDQNELASGKRYFRIGVFRVSPDQNILAYAVDTTGGESFTLYFKDLRNNKIFKDKIDNVSYGLEWGNDNKTVFYTTLDKARRPYKLFRHVLKSVPGEDELVYHEKDESYFLGISKTRSKKYLLMTLESQITTEVRYLDADHPGKMFRIIHPRQHGMEYYVDHRGDYFYILTNDEALNFKVMRAPVKAPAKSNWEELIPHKIEIKIEDINLFEDYLVVVQREKGLKKVLVHDFNEESDYFVDFPEPVYTVSLGRNPEFSTDSLRYTYMSLVTPRSVYDYNMKTRERILKKRYEVLGGYYPENYISERLYAKAKDGTEIPISIVYKKGLKKNGNNPCYLYGYGSYGSNMDPYFSSNRISLLNRGFIFAMAHIRGGGEMGRQWYEDGKLLKKKNTFTDFIACAEHLISEKYTNPEKLVISGGSAGGLLMGAVTNMRPDLFKVVIARVPFVDVINTMMDASIPLTVIEYEEWGNPNKKEYYDYMKSYSPYDNVTRQGYPNMLITAGLNDPRVQYWEPAKWTAKLREMNTDNSVILLKTNMGAGHGGASGRYDYLKEIAFQYAFIFNVFGIKE